MEKWVVWEGTPSWHQKRAGNYLGAACTTGFESEAQAKEFAERLKAHHPEMRVLVMREGASNG